MAYLCGLMLAICAVTMHSPRAPVPGFLGLLLSAWALTIFWKSSKFLMIGMFVLGFITLAVFSSANIDDFPSLEERAKELHDLQTRR